MRRDTSETIFAEMGERAAASGDPRLVITFPIDVPKNFTEEEITKLLQAQGYTRIHHREGTRLEVVQDRVKMSSAEKARVVEAIEAALRVGNGRVNVFVESTMRSRPPGRGGFPPTCIARIATSTTRIRRRRVLVQLARSARATRAAASGA